MAIVPFTDPQAFGLVGSHVNSEEWNAITRQADGVADAPFGFGQPVQRVTGDSFRCEAWDGTSAPLGITRWTINNDPVAGYAQGDSVSIMTAGVINGAAGDECTAGAQAGYDAATDRWADAGGDYVAVPGVEIENNSDVGALVKLRVARPSPAVIVEPAEPVGP